MDVRTIIQISGLISSERPSITKSEYGRYKERALLKLHGMAYPIASTGL